MIVKRQTEHHSEFLSLKGGYRGWSGSTHVKMRLSAFTISASSQAKASKFTSFFT